MAVQLKVERFGKPTALGVGGFELDRDRRINLYHRRRRAAQIREMAETVVWVGATAGLLLIAVGGLLTLR